MIDLELHARHLSLIGIAGQEKLCALKVSVQSTAPWADTTRLALARAGVQLVDAAPFAIKDGAANRIVFGDAHIAVGASDAPATWLGALVAAECLWWALGHRRPNLSVSFPEISYESPP